MAYLDQLRSTAEDAGWMQAGFADRSESGMAAGTTRSAS